ncbi:hypothetical protein OIU76_026482 [Salix suchowensis]|nr:hypothetical protein OIU76_026482 [Salix suchowensis]
MAMAKYSTQTWNIFHPITHHFPRKSPNHSVSLPFYKTPSDFSSLSTSPHLNNNLAPAHLSFKAFASSSSSSSSFFSWECRIHRGNSNQREIPDIIEFTGLLYLIIVAWNWIQGEGFCNNWC